MAEKQTIHVVKRSGNRVPLDLEKIHKVLFWACADLRGVSVSDIEIQAKLQLVDGVSTKDIHDILIRAASDLISEEFPNYQYVASKLLNMALRKEVFGKGLDLPPLRQVVCWNWSLHPGGVQLRRWQRCGSAA